MSVHALQYFQQTTYSDSSYITVTSLMCCIFCQTPYDFMQIETEIDWYFLFELLSAWGISDSWSHTLIQWGFTKETEATFWLELWILYLSPFFSLFLSHCLSLFSGFSVFQLLWIMLKITSFQNVWAFQMTFSRLCPVVTEPFAASLMHSERVQCSQGANLCLSTPRRTSTHSLRIEALKGSLTSWSWMC